jgi:hypothetical protein
MRCKHCGGMLRVLGGALKSLVEYYECRHCHAKWMLGPAEGKQAA